MAFLAICNGFGSSCCVCHPRSSDTGSNACQAFVDSDLNRDRLGPGWHPAASLVKSRAQSLEIISATDLQYMMLK